MANPDHLMHIRSGKWNEWRDAHPAISPDLIDAELNPAVPEPGTLMLLGLGLLATGFSRIRGKKD